MPSPKKLMQVRSFSCCFVGIASYYSLLPMHFHSSPHLRSMYFSHPHIMRHLSSSQLLLSPSCSMAFLSLSYLELVYCEKPVWYSYLHQLPVLLTGDTPLFKFSIQT